MNALIGDRNSECRSFGKKAEERSYGAYAGAEKATEKERNGKDDGKENDAEPKGRSQRAPEERIRVKKT